MTNRKYPAFPLVGVAALVLDQGRILLVKRKYDPGKGLWSLPGGLINLGEKIENALVREVEEETGLRVEIDDLLSIIDRIRKGKDGRIIYHYIVIGYLARPREGKLKASSDAEDAGWFRSEEISSFSTTRVLEYFIEVATKRGILI
ncbi:MAG: NUDIX hydrolase [Promethearchaeota archaeon]